MGLTRNLLAMVIIDVLTDEDMKAPYIQPRGVAICYLDGFFMLSQFVDRHRFRKFREVAISRVTDMQRGALYNVEVMLRSERTTVVVLRAPRFLYIAAGVSADKDEATRRLHVFLLLASADYYYLQITVVARSVEIVTAPKI